MVGAAMLLASVSAELSLLHVWDVRHSLPPGGLLGNVLAEGMRAAFNPDLNGGSGNAARFRVRRTLSLARVGRAAFFATRRIARQRPCRGDARGVQSDWREFGVDCCDADGALPDNKFFIPHH